MSSVDIRTDDEIVFVSKSEDDAMQQQIRRLRKKNARLRKKLAAEKKRLALIANAVSIVHH